MKKQDFKLLTPQFNVRPGKGEYIVFDRRPDGSSWVGITTLLVLSEVFICSCYDINCLSDFSSSGASAKQENGWSLYLPHCVSAPPFGQN